ncbi:MAG: transposase [Bacteroidales bacterium]|nr:transposase [Bacteroidales bacterium]
MRYFSRYIPDKRDPFRIVHSIEKILKQRVLTLMQGYEDANDVAYLKSDPLYHDILDGEMASQPTMYRFENRIGKPLLFALCSSWVDRYVSSLKGRKSVVIDIEPTDNPPRDE